MKQSIRKTETNRSQQTESRSWKEGRQIIRLHEFENGRENETDQTSEKCFSSERNSLGYTLTKTVHAKDYKQVKHMLLQSKQRLLMPPPRWPSGLGVRHENGRSWIEPRFSRGGCSGSSHTIDFKIGHLEATLPGAWLCRVRDRTGCQYAVNG